MTSPAWLDRNSWPFRAKFQDVPGGRLHYVDVGEGPVVVFVHGTPTWAFDWRALISGLSRDHRCIAVDHLGFGLSDRPADADYRPEAHAARFAAFLERLDLRDATLVVHDFGGPIALPAAVDGTRITRVVITNTFAWSLTSDRQMGWGAVLLGSFVGRWLYRWANLSLRVITPTAYADRKKLTPALHGQLLAPFVGRDARVRVLWALARSLLGSTAFYAALEPRLRALADRPVLLLWGMADPAFPVRYLHRWQALLPRAQVVELAGAGHWPHEEEPERYLAAVRDFLEATPEA